MSSFAFEAKSVAIAHPDGEFYLVGFADREFDTNFYLVLQRALDFDEQDVALGMDTYHVEWCDQASSSYGGISQSSLQPGRAEIEFSKNAADALGGLERLSIFFQLTSSGHMALQEVLGRIFEGSGCLSVTDA